MYRRCCLVRPGKCSICVTKPALACLPWPANCSTRLAKLALAWPGLGITAQCVAQPAVQALLVSCRPSLCRVAATSSHQH